MSSRAPQVSFVITAYNAERFIGTSVRAALSQTVSDLEVLVLDDGSTDRTGEICLAIHDERLRYIQRPRIGRCRALNEAIAAARGAYIAINDADDVSFPHRVDYTLGFLLRHPEVSYVGTGFVGTDVFQERLPSEVGSQVDMPVLWPRPSSLFRRNQFNNSTLMYPKTTWRRIGGYDEALGNSEDYDFYLRALQCGPAALLPGRTVLWYTNPHGYFKQKSQREHLRAIGVIRRRAHKLLGLPFWLQGYHTAWCLSCEVTRRYPGLIGVASEMRRRARHLRLTPWRARSP